MATKDITDLQVVEAFAEMKRQMDCARDSDHGFEHADDILVRITGQAEKVCTRAMERAGSRGLIEYGMWLRGGWLTEKGAALLAANAEFRRPPDAVSGGSPGTPG